MRNNIRYIIFLNLNTKFCFKYNYLVLIFRYINEKYNFFL